jgi:uncharacterized protein YlzI (FlbEa/FlbD family)
MKFIKLESRGGNYLVVAENIAWLRTAENGQTSVGMMGGQPLLVVGSIEEVAEKILNATRNDEQPAAPVPAETGQAAPAPAETAPHVSANPAPSTPPANNESESYPAIGEDTAPEPEPEPEPKAVAPNPEKIALAPQSTPATPSASESTPPDPSPAIVRLTNRNPVPLWERAAPRAAASTATPRVKAGSQRFMGKLD